MTQSSAKACKGVCMQNINDKATERIQRALEPSKDKAHTMEKSRVQRSQEAEHPSCHYSPSHTPTQLPASETGGIQRKPCTSETPHFLPTVNSRHSFIPFPPCISKLPTCGWVCFDFPTGEDPAAGFHGARGGCASWLQNPVILGMWESMRAFHGVSL